MVLLSLRFLQITCPQQSPNFWYQGLIWWKTNCPWMEDGGVGFGMIQAFIVHFIISNLMLLLILQEIPVQGGWGPVQTTCHGFFI